MRVLQSFVPIALLAITLDVAAAAPTGAVDDPALAHARRLLASTILIDGHNDLPWAISEATAHSNSLDTIDLERPTKFQTDIPRLRAGLVGGQFWSVYVPGETVDNPVLAQLEQIDLARRFIARYPASFELATTAQEVRAAHRRGHIASLLGAEGGHVIQDSLSALRQYYALGVRYMTLTHFSHNDWADSATQLPARHHGLSPFGREVVREMNRLGMLVDLSHTSAETMAQALNVSEAPVIFSHSGARAVTDHPRNVADDILVRVGANGGIVMATFVPGFVDSRIAKIMAPLLLEYGNRVRSARTPAEVAAIQKEVFGRSDAPKTNVAAVADHLDHIRRIAGVEHVGIGSDFDGSADMPEGLSDVSMYPNLFAELIRRGWTDADLRKLAGENVLRTLEQAENTARRLQAGRPPSTARIAVLDHPPQP